MDERMAGMRAEISSRDGRLRYPARFRPLRDLVQETLTELIVDGTLQPGQHLVEKDVAGMLEVSRQPVREALQALHHEGWVDLRPGRGAFVHQPTPREADEVLTVRASLECLVASLASRNCSKSALADLAQICRVGRAAVRADDTRAVVDANSRFHRTLAAATENSFLRDAIDTIDRRVRWYFRRVALTRGMASWDEHEAMLELIAVGDEAGAVDVMRRHTESTRTTYVADPP